jgi:glycosyltransferase involved in cell wall biosynthesis
MRLLIISHTAHYFRKNKIVGWGPTVREVDWLGRAFDQVTHLACFHPGPAPESALEYQIERIRFLFVPPAGGLSLRKKLKVILVMPRYVRAVLESIPEADVIQIRSPSPLAMVAMVLVGIFARQPRWVKYAGNWVEAGKLPPSFAFQRWWLKTGLSRGPVTVNGRWPDQRSQIFSLDNPSFTLSEIETARRIAWDKRLDTPIRCLFVGKVEPAKGIRTALEVISGLTKQGYEVLFDILGDGPERPKYERMSQALGIERCTRFHGWVSHDQVKDYLARSHFLLHPSITEGWPKALSEAMAFGVVPLSSRVSAIPQILEETKAGFALDPQDTSGFIKKIIWTIEHSEQWKRLSRAGIEAAPRFSYEQYLVNLDEMFRKYYGESLLKPEVLAEMRAKYLES